MNDEDRKKNSEKTWSPRDTSIETGNAKVFEDRSLSVAHLKEKLTAKPKPGSKPQEG